MMNSYMEMNTIVVLVLLTGTFLSAHLVRAQGQAGFISLDCGLPEGGDYTAKFSGINYKSDASYIDSGVSMSIDPDDRLSFEPELWNVRSFPRGLRNCYNLKLKQGDKYLIKAKFKYGNYDNKSELPQFDLYIGPNKWTTAKLDFKSFKEEYELIHVLTSDNLQLCLVKSGSTTPFISALELRPLSVNAYNSSQSGSLMKDNRYFMSNFSLSVLGYPEDIHDRTWSTRFNLSYWGQVNTSQRIDTNNGYDLPQETVKYAAMPVNGSVDFVYSWFSDGTPSKYRVFLHFTEVQTLKPSEFREFNITFNGKYLYGPFSPRKFKLDTIFSQQPLDITDFTYTIGFQRTPRSTLPPILNAVEIFKVIELPQPVTDDNDVSAIMNIKATYEMTQISWEGDPCLPQDFLWDGLNCSYNNKDPPRITVLKLSGSGLKGKIAPFVSSLSELKELDLSNNNLTGEVPGFLAKLKSLSIINLSGNQLSGSVPQALLNKEKDGSLKLNVDGNPKLCKQESCSKSGRNIIVPVVASVVSLVIVIALVAAFFIIRKKKQKSSSLGMEARNSATAPSDKRPPISQNREITYSDIMNITNNFKRVLGQGGFGIVYHGCLKDSTPVAVKVLSHTSIQGYKQFMAEVELLLRVHHRNLVSLAGYCSERDNLALIYEYMANGDLREYLSGEHGNSTLNWVSRLRMVIQAAQGLEYLHNGCKPPIVHRDVKSTNILLNENFQAKLSDFGLSRTFSAGGESHVSTVVAGTPGYLDPEYFQTNRLTEKSDVYSFGIVLLEIITNQPVIDNTREKSHITEWTRQMLQKGDINRMVDPKLQGDFDKNSIWNVLELAMACLNPSSNVRPTMHQVVMELNRSLSMVLTKSQVSQETNLIDDFSLDVSTNAASALMPAPR